MSALWLDLRFACRTLRRAPAFALSVLLTMAVGIGATTTILTVTRTVFTPPPLYVEPERIVRVGPDE